MPFCCSQRPTVVMPGEDERCCSATKGMLIAHRGG
jgi:hypothetical protein